MNIITFTYIGVFMVLQLVLLSLTVFNIILPNQFLIELNTLILVMMILLNINAGVMYCRNAGNPYLSDKCKRYVRTFKCVIILWNMAFIVKIFLTTTGSTIGDIEQ